MTELLTAAQMRAMEQAAIDSGQVTGLELMERAGRGVVEAIFEEWPELATTSGVALVLCGPGNNGGDGFVIARLLKEWGWEVEVFLYGDPNKLPPDAEANYHRWMEMGGVHDFMDEIPDHIFPLTLDKNGVVVDALFGTGLTRPLAKDAEIKLLNFFSQSPMGFLNKVSVDVRSGIDSDSGRFLAERDDVFALIAAELCVTFHRAKLGHYLGDPCFSSLRVKDIGIDKINSTLNHHRLLKGFDQLFSIVSESKDADTLRQTLLSGEDRSDIALEVDADPVRLLNGPSDEFQKYADANKYSHGHAVILSGGSGKTGAARLSVRGALRIGAGLVTLGVPSSAQMEVATQVTAIMMQRVDGADGLSDVLQDERLNALCLGPGLGIERARDLVPVALEAKRATVLDADALTAFVDDPSRLFTNLHDNCVLTPHGGEFARLFPDIAEKLNAVPTKGPAYSKVDATREAAQRAGCVVLFKGPDTVIADPGGRCSINSAHYERAAPWLATAGSGDVLAGFITGLLARGFAPMQAAETAAWLHVECALLFGPGLIAEDLPEQLPMVFREIDI
ncbi:NAD(P)H-hydrate dehydratase [Ruegeria sp.]|uniref:NAD(P)H-hydrate dehydratase n=1 Tax=Ruegeria sp. TaxID=1879320 RepID=UPI003C7A1515